MNLKEKLKRYLVPGVLGALNIDSWRRTAFNRRNELETKNLERLLNNSTNPSEIAELTEKIKSLKELGTTRYNDISARTGRLEELSNKQESLTEKIRACDNQLFNNNYGPGQNRDTVLSMKNYYEKEFDRSHGLEKAETQDLKNYIDTINKEDSFDWVWDLIESYRDFLDTLSLDQLVALFNLSGYYMIFSASISICFILAGDRIIQRLNLEVKYPRLSIFIKARSKFSKVSLSIHVFMLFAVIVIFTAVNIYMFLNSPK